MLADDCITHLVTHDGGFHADELLSSVILTQLFPDAEIVRTRDAGWTAPGAGKVVYDVGRAYDPEARVFDHHQRPAPLRDDGQPLSAFGLIWRHYGRDYLRALDVPEADLDALHASFERSFVLPIDLVDNGVMDPGVAGALAPLTLPELLESLKPVFDNRSPGAADRAFADALPIARAFVEATLARKAAKRRAEAVVTQAIRDAGASRILELPMGMPFRSAIEAAGADHLLFVVNPRDTDWAIGGIRVREGSFEQRADLPEPWAGLTDAALEAVCGVEGAKFCHNGRFIAVAATREAAMKMAELAVAEAERTPGAA
ncbi:metal-dependent hydrolase [Meridianimarinicoccus roseus]|uniref:Metal-dependent hydrolase n=1 Tax=Meridianimarinicoccus roseus TaxID=2072018 RepID=A0A2V2LBV9_9RHOB|nr:MYG1 family protein [Meridianimarinicoccus roseus]PWR01221.1 metal-dependent hydrolase [Meridianimarinicoccus roseus]